MGSVNKKTIIIFSSIICVPILIILLLVLMRGCSKSLTYDVYEDKMIDAAEKYAKEKNKLPKNDGGIVIIDLDALEKNGYLKKSKEVFKNETCSGTVTVKNNNGNYLYVPDLQCEKYKTRHLIDILLENVVDNKSGLYKTDDGYVYKGLKVNNYVSIHKKMYRIISIDNNNILKLVSLKQEDKTYTWDTKYNVEKKQSVGKNDYADSNIYDLLNEKYQQMSKSEKKHFVSYDLCIGKRSKENLSIDKTEECSSILPNQFIGLLNTYDFAMASYDSDCKDIKSGACQNYNYLLKSLNTTWLLNGVSNNSYDVFYYSSGYINYSNAYYSKKIHYVFYIDGNELYVKGDGTKENPYVLK